MEYILHSYAKGLAVRLIIDQLTGHCILKCYLNKISLAEDDICERCWEEEETAEYCLCKCSRYTILRLRTFSGLLLL